MHEAKEQSLQQKIDKYNKQKEAMSIRYITDLKKCKSVLQDQR